MDERIEAVQRIQDYIESNLDEDISLADLAKVAGYSPWYSYRLFHSLLHMTPAVYIRRLRLSKSALRLRDEKVKIIDVEQTMKQPVRIPGRVPGCLGQVRHRDILFKMAFNIVLHSLHSFNAFIHLAHHLTCKS